MLFTGFTVLYMFLFHLPLFLAEKVLFYRGLLLLPVAIVLTIGALLIFKQSLKHIRLESIVAGFMVAISLNLMFFVLFPVTFDRSVTMFLLNDLRVNAQITTCTGLSKEYLQNHFINGYVLGESDAIGRRMFEQHELGFVKGNDSCWSLTDKSKNFLKLSEFIGALYDLRY